MATSRLHTGSLTTSSRSPRSSTPSSPIAMKPQRFKMGRGLTVARGTAPMAPQRSGPELLVGEALAQVVAPGTAAPELAATWAHGESGGDEAAEGGRQAGQSRARLRHLPARHGARH